MSREKVIEIMARARCRRALGIRVTPKLVEDYWRTYTPALEADLSALEAAGYVIVPKEPTEAMKRAAFGPIMHGGRYGPITADLIRQEAGLDTYRAMIAASQEPT